jgi:hypothetical protein
LQPLKLRVALPKADEFRIHTMIHGVIDIFRYWPRFCIDIIATKPHVFRSIHDVKELIMSNKSQQSAGITAALSIAIGVCISFLSSSGFAAPTGPTSVTAEASGSQLANPAQRGVVLLVHPQKSTAAFLSILHLPVAVSENGRFAVLNLSGAENKDARYALVYVPQGVEVKPHDVVTLEPGASELTRQPGQAVVAMIANNGGLLSATVFGGEVSKVVLVPTKNGRSELWIEDRHTGDVEIFVPSQGDIRIQ